MARDILPCVLAFVACVWSAPVQAEETAVSSQADRALRLLTASDLFSKKAGLLELEALRDPSTLTAVRPFLDDPNPALRAQALATARAIQGAAAIPLLTDALARDRSEIVRRQAANELHELRDPSTVPALTSALQDRRVTVRIAAVEALGAMHDQSVTPAIIEQVRSRDAELRRSSLDALGTLKDSQAKPVMIKRARDRDVNVRRAAVQALARLKDPSTVPVFIRALRDKDDTVRKLAMKALGGLVTNASLPDVGRLLNAGRPVLRLYAIGLLDHLGTPEALALLQARRLREWNDVLKGTLDRSIARLERRLAAATEAAPATAFTPSPSSDAVKP